MKRTFSSALVAGLTLAMTPAVIAQGTSPVQAAPTPVPASAGATTSVDTLTARVLGVALPPPVNTLSAADIEVGDVEGSLTNAAQRATAHAANLDAAAVGVPLDGILSSADQSAPPDNAAPVTATTIPTINAAPLVTAGVSNSSANARFKADGTCLPAATALSTSTTSTTDVEAVTVPGVGALLGLPGTVSTTQSIHLASTGGAKDARRVTARTSSNIVSANLFGSLQIGVSSAPQITASASGTSPATVTYNQPVVSVTGGPQDYVLDAANETAAFALPENPLLGLELSLGALTKSEAADGTKASGSAALLHVRLFLVNALTPDPSDGVDVAQVDLVPMRATASAPLGGITCGDDPGTDSDDDGLDDDDETKNGTDPKKDDTDGDGLTDGVEVNKTKTDPLDPDTDNDGLTDGQEVLGMVIKQSFKVCGQKARKSIRVTTNPLVKDTDKDGLTDGREVKGFVIKQRVTFTRSGKTLTIGKTRTNPTKADSDRDRVKDKAEKTGSANKAWKRGKTDPTKCDTDRGGASDGREVKAGSDPTRIKSGPNDIKKGRMGRSSIG